MKHTNYHPDWQVNRIKFILSKYPIEFFKGKRILELGAYNGFMAPIFLHWALKYIVLKVDKKMWIRLK